jgi:hypothetical protein
MTGPRQPSHREFKQIIRRRRLCPARPPAHPSSAATAHLLQATVPLASLPPQAHPRTLLHQPNKPSSSPSFLQPADAHLPAAAPIPDHTRPAEVSQLQLQLQPLASNLLGPLSALDLARSRSPQSSAVNASSFNQQSVPLCFRPHLLGRPSGGAWTLRAGAFSCVRPLYEFEFEPRHSSLRYS